jgi:hypothetical protein
MTYNTQGYNLFLDDERFPSKVTWCVLPTYHDPHWKIVRNYDEFVAAIKELGVPQFVSFDHDLADEHYVEGFAGATPRTDYREKTGYDCAKFLLAHCMENGHHLPPFAVHSMNPVGRENIRALLGTRR